MRRVSTVLALAAAALLAAPTAFAAAAVQVTDAWSRPAAVGTNGAGFMTVTNHGKAADTLKAVESPAVTRVEMHQTSMANGVMSMRRLDAGLAVPAGQSVTFAPGGYHLMLIGLKQALKVGDVVPATLTFASGARLKVSFPVRSAADTGMRH